MTLFAQEAAVVATTRVGIHHLVALLLGTTAPENWLGLQYNDIPRQTVYEVSVRQQTYTYVAQTDTWWIKDPSQTRLAELHEYGLGIAADGTIASGSQSVEHLLESYYRLMPRAPWGGRKALRQYFGQVG